MDAAKRIKTSDVKPIPRKEAVDLRPIKRWYEDPSGCTLIAIRTKSVQNEVMAAVCVK